MENIKAFLLDLKNPNTITFKSLIIVLMLSLTVIPLSYAIFRNLIFVDGTLASAVWDVTLVQNGISNDLTVVPGSSNATYTLNVKSLSEVDVKYSITLSNLPTGVEASIDGVTFPPVSNGTVTFTNAGTILYSAGGSTNSHTLTFRGTNEATTVDSQAVTVNVVAEQMINS
jgi:hypothetical protein